MALLKSPVIGVPSGKVGDLIIRNRNGKSFYYKAPVNFKISKSAAAVQGRSNFASTVALALSVNSSPMLKEIWKVAKVPGTNAYQKLIKNNAKLVRSGLLTTSNKITPEGLPLDLNSAAIENSKLILSMNCQPASDLTFPAIFLIYLYFGETSGAIIPLIKKISEPAPGGKYYLETDLDSRIKRLFSKDPSPIVFISLIGGTTFKKKVYWTSTASAKL